MSANLFRNVLLVLTMMAMLMMAVVAYGRYHNAEKEIEDSCVCTEPSPNTELPWEALASQWLSSVSW